MAAPTRKDIEIALNEGQLTLHFQPIVTIPLVRISGFEALLRWRRPGGRLEAPSEFIRVAEDTGQIVEVGRWVLRAACAAATRIQHAVEPECQLTMSVNVSAAQWQSASIFLDVESALAESNLNPRQLKLELTESSLVSLPEVTRAAMVRFKDDGIGCCIDDFGTGYASLNYLSEFPVDTLKIDRSFIRKIGVHGNALEIPRAIVDLAHSLRMDVIAEGVETPEQLREIRQLNCEYVQGFLFSMPLSENDAIDFAESNLEATVPGARIDNLVEGNSTIPMVVWDRSDLSDQYESSAAIAGISGAFSGNAVALTKGSTTLGRGDDADVVIKDIHLSRQHARIVCDDSVQFFLEDCGSTNGTFCNGQRVQRCPLRNGDRIRIGTCVVEFRAPTGRNRRGDG